MPNTRATSRATVPSRSSERELCALALAARNNAHAPYSKFSVGAALRTSSGRVFTGCNVENASFGLTICAERNAVAAAVAAGEREFKAIAIATDLREPASPCGACRQVLAEFAPELRVLLTNPEGRIMRLKLSTLLPRRFDPSQVQRRR
ncbi:MAG: cytidine deaminase [Pseudomonadota bacterium]